jgi:phosphatidylserine/phosphatidylglycerophosphate/cardiolipin synthase-like enzyme
LSPAEIEELLARTFVDRHLSRNERRELAEVFRDVAVEGHRALISSRAFALVREVATGPGGADVIDWLEEVVKLLHRDESAGRPADLLEAHFSPGDNCPRRIAQLFAQARRAAEVCVFTITDDRLTAALLDAHARGVALRIITDNDKVFDEGSDIARLAGMGIPVKVDAGEYHMHHKFAIFDDATLLTGSYNWTRGASSFNNENFVVTGERRLIAPFAETFERLWRQFRPFDPNRGRP